LDVPTDAPVDALVDTLHTSHTSHTSHTPPTSLYRELLHYHIANPHHGFYDPFDDMGAMSGHSPQANDHAMSYEDAHAARELCRQQDDDFATSLRKDRAKMRWHKLRIVVSALTELCRWRRTHACHAVIRAIQHYEASCRQRCFSSNVSQSERNAIGTVIQQNKNIERWCRLWLANPNVRDWDERKLLEVQLHPH
jgi:hypothetical protein